MRRQNPLYTHAWSLCTRRSTKFVLILSVHDLAKNKRRYWCVPLSENCMRRSVVKCSIKQKVSEIKIGNKIIRRHRQ